MRGLQLAGRVSGHNEMSWPLGRYAERTGSGTRDVRIGRRPAGPATAARGGSRRARSVSDRRPVQHAHAADAGRGCRRRHLRLRPGSDSLRAEPDLHRRHLHRVRGRDGVRRAIEDAVPGDQPQLAGERSLPGRDHDRVWRADEGDTDRRRRQVRRRDAWRLPPPAHRGPLYRIRNARVGRELGRGRRRLRRRKLLRQHQPRGDPQGPVADGCDGAVLPRLSARRRRRADRRARSHQRAAARGSSRGVRSPGLRRRRHAVRRFPCLRRVRGPAWLRQHVDRARHRLRRAVLGSDGVAAVRGRRRPAQRHRHEEGRRLGERRRVCGVGRHLFIQRRGSRRRRRHAHADGVSRISVALWFARLHGDRRRHVRRAALRRQVGRPRFVLWR